MTLRQIKEKHLPPDYTPDPDKGTFCMSEEVLDNMLIEAYCAGLGASKPWGGKSDGYMESFKVGHNG